MSLREQNKTIIIIAHRLSTVLHADTIVVLDKGKVIENGSHNLLFKNKGLYYNLWKQQMPVFELWIQSYNLDSVIPAKAGIF